MVGKIEKAGTCKCGGFQIVFMSTGMQDLDGVEIAKEIRKINKSTVIVAAASQQGTEDIETCLQSGMNDYSKCTQP